MSSFNQVGTKITLSVPQGEFLLQRFPINPHDQLQAWDAADELVLQHLSNHDLSIFRSLPSQESKSFQRTNNPQHILLVNDQWGALYKGVRAQYPHTTIYSLFDNVLARYALSEVSDPLLHIVNHDTHFGLQSTISHLTFDYVLIKNHKSHDRLKIQIQDILPYTDEHTMILAADMSKYIQSSTLKIFQYYWHQVHTSLAIKKARLIHLSHSKKKATHTPIPSFKTYQIEDNHKRYTIQNLAGVFAYGKYDIGSQALLPHIPNDLGSKSVLDLGCGDGILGLIALVRNPMIHMIWSDISYTAIHSLKRTLHHWIQEGIFTQQQSIQIICQDKLQSIEDQSIDYILINPPFHSQRAISHQIAEDMLIQSYRALKPEGELLLVGNRHLKYHHVLRKIFGHYQQKGGTHKLVVLHTCKKSKHKNPMHEA